MSMPCSPVAAAVPSSATIRNPKLVEGKFSVQYCVSVVLADGQAGEEQFRDAKVGSRELAEFVRKEKIAANPL